MPVIEKSPDGNYYELVNNEWRKYEGITPDDMAAVEQYRNESPGLGIGQGVMNMLGGDYWAPSLLGMTANEYQAAKMQQREDTPLSVLGGEVGTGLVGAVAAGPSALAQIGTGAAFGASMNSENPLQGAALGGAIGAIIPGAQAAWANRVGLGNLAERGLTGAANALEVAGAGPRMASMGLTPSRMADRIAARAGAAGGAQPPAAGAALMGQADESGRALQGFLTAEEAAQTGLPLTYGDELALAARNSDELAHAQRVRMAEELRRSDPVTGRLIESAREAQKDWATLQVKQRLGIEGGMQLTDDVLGQKLNQLGREFDQFADEVGSVTLTDDVATALDDIAEQATGTHGSQIARIAADARKMAGQNDGALTGQDWQLLRTRLGKMIEAGGRQGDAAKIGDAVEMQNLLIDLMESNLPQASREAMQMTRSQYGLAKTLLKRTGNLSADGRVNSRSLYGSLKTAGRIRNRADDSLLRMLETDRFLTDRVMPSSGTAERLLANPGRTAINTAIGTGLTGGVATGANMLLGD